MYISHPSLLAMIYAFTGAFLAWFCTWAYYKRKVPESVITHDLVALVRKYANEIDNGRSIYDVYRHFKSEVSELDVEMNTDAGPDGIVGESIDAITCLLDLIVVYKPEMTDAEIMALATKKLEKWKRRYAMSIEGDRSID